MTVTQAASFFSNKSLLSRRASDLFSVVLNISKYLVAEDDAIAKFPFFLEKFSDSTWVEKILNFFQGSSVQNISFT